MTERQALLAGDIGGTKTALAFFEVDPSGSLPDRDPTLLLRDERIYPSREYESFDEIVRQFLVETGIRPTFAAFGAAGPVLGDSVQVTNLPWVVTAEKLKRAFAFEDVRLVNDVEANAWGLAELGEDDLLMLRRDGTGLPGHRVLVSPGTGLGIAGLYWDGRRHRPFATEGGHAGFAPENEVEQRLFRFAARRGSRVTWEDLVAGPGLPLLYEFVVSDQDLSPEPALLSRIRAGDGPPAVTEYALSGASRAAAETVRLYIRLLGSVAGNAALQFLASGGVFLGGGIVPRLAERLVEDGLLDALSNKPPMTRLLEDIPVYAVLRPNAALWGAARVAALLVPASGSS